MKRLLRLLPLLCLALLTSAPGADRDRPNIVLIMADDMGFSDIGCYGGEVETPNIDKLATNGLRFTQFYNTARCCPTRASLLTGLYPHQAGVPHMVDNTRLPLEKRQLSRNALTIAEVLRTNGYRTAMAGKWHVTPVPNATTNGPLARGFDEFYGIIHGAASFYEPVTLMRNSILITNFPPGYFFTDAIAENASEFIHNFAREDKPFFIYTAFTAPHWPLHAPAEDYRKYLERYARGWDVLRQERYRRMLEMGILDDSTRLSPRDDEAPPWNDVEHKEWQAHRMAVYAAQIERMDKGIGRIVEALRKTGELDNTLIFFLADNGGCAEILGPNARALHVPLKAPDGSPMRRGNSPEIFPGPPDTYASYGLPWANLSNTPFRTYKHWVHEGGIATPLIVHWPAAIKVPGIRQDPGHLIDIMATCVDAAKGSYPRHFAGHSVQPLEGKSLLPLFEGRSFAQRPIYFEHEGNRAVRMGEWKAVSKFPEDWELYNLAADRSELENLASREPQLLSELVTLYENWAQRVKVPDPELVTPPRRKP